MPAKRSPKKKTQQKVSEQLSFPLESVVKKKKEENTNIENLIEEFLEGPSIVENTCTPTPADILDDWEFTYSYYNNPVKVVRKLMRKGLYTDKDILGWCNSYPRLKTCDDFKADIVGKDPIQTLCELLALYPSPTELFACIRRGDGFKDVYNDIVSVTMETAEYTTPDGQKDMAIGMGFVLAARDGCATFIISTTRNEFLKRGYNGSRNTQI